GFWSAYPPYRKLGLDFYDLATPGWFAADPTLAWGFYGHRLNLYRGTVPHPGFALLRQWAAARPSGYFVFTSNVDGQFQKTGFDAEKVNECHGSLHYLQCLANCSDSIWPAADLAIAVEEETMRAQPPLPACPDCGRLARPNVLMFGDWNWLPGRSREQQRLFQNWLANSGEKNLVIIECGAGTAVPSVRRLSEQLLTRPGTSLIRINKNDAEVPSGQVGLAGSALPVLRAIEKELTG
ncbi:MAG: NAD-dependent protein deacetylase, partial [Acidobacteria bacterium]|nr:NAD-dependent protein deacetylase [Acidobacteriota bacterium]MCG2810055.1 NAD-dependent protein deacetylase [Candidatus Aminicenantes bacterium]